MYNTTDVQVRFSDYFQVNIDNDLFDKAKEFYFKWCKKNKETPEISDGDDFADISQSELEHVLYHANMEGLEIGS